MRNVLGKRRKGNQTTHFTFKNVIPKIKPFIR